ncbi:MAG: hypothetical protein KTV77_05195 [Wolbachia endosymbiont of Fragariocoptes setiger]|nr:hypothetical protein [Wolbachia endosymbiont of Fragariocoptes setiger]
MKSYLYAGLFILLFLTVAQLSVKLKDWSSYKDFITHHLENTYNAKVYIIGKVEISLITPKLSIHNVYIKYNNGNAKQRSSDLISMSKIEIKPYFLSLLKFSPKPSSFVLFNMRSNKENLLKIAHKSGNIDNVIIKNAHINNEDISIDIEELEVKKNKKFSGKAKINDNYYNFLGKISITSENIDINIESNMMSLSFKGNKNQKTINGSLSIVLNNDSSLINNVIKVININLPYEFLPNEKIKILSEISISESKFAVTNIKIGSSSIQADGMMKHDKKSNHSSINLVFKKFDLDLIESKRQKKIYIKDVLECFKNVIPKNLSLDLNIDSSNIQYRRKILSNLIIGIKFADGKAAVHTVLKLPGINNMFYLSGKISSNDILSSFDGSIEIEGNDFTSFISYFYPTLLITDNKKNSFTFHSKVHAAPRTIYILDATLTNDEEFIQGLIRVNYTKKNNMIDGRVTAYNIHSNRYSFNILNKADWLKNFMYEVNIKADVRNLLINNQKIKSLDFLLHIEKNKLSANKIKIDGENFNTFGDIKVLTEQKYIKPLININLEGKEFNGNILKLPQFIEKTNRTMEWSKENFHLLNKLENFDANIHINTETFLMKKSKLKNFNLDALIRNNTATIRQIEYLIHDGKVIFQGHLKPDSIYVKFFVSEIEIDRISEFNDIKGLVNVNGSMRTQGKSFYDWSNNLSGEVNIRGKKMLLSHLDLDSFITDLLNSKTRAEIVTLTGNKIYKGSTPVYNLNGKATIINGTFSTSLQFATDKSSGSISANLILSNFTVNSIMRLFFIPPNRNNPIYIDAHIDGPILKPKLSFEVEQIFTALN